MQTGLVCSKLIVRLEARVELSETDFDLLANIPYRLDDLGSVRSCSQ
jgi:hypothetical protein